MVMHYRATQRTQKLTAERAFHPLDSVDSKGTSLCTNGVSLIYDRVDGQNIHVTDFLNAVAVRKKTLDVSDRTERETRAEVLGCVKNWVLRIRSIRVNIVIAEHRNDRRSAEFSTDFQRVLPSLLESLDASPVR